MTERNLHQELLDELKTDRPEVVGYEYLSTDPIGNHIYANDGQDGRALASEYKVLLGGDPEKVQTLVFQTGNPKEQVNGITIETLLDIEIDRITKLNDAVPSWHNNLAIDGLALTANVLNKRNVDRINAGVQGQDVELPKKGTKENHPIVRRIMTNNDKFTFILLMMTALSESFDEIYDHEVNGEFVEITEEGPKRKVETNAEEDEAITVGVASAQKVLAVLENTNLFRTIYGTIVHSKKLQASTQQPTTPTSDTNAPASDSTQVEI